jgi:hypothetical protein
MLNPIQRSLSQFRRRLMYGRKELYLIEFLSRKPLGKLPRRQMQRLHAAAPALLAKESCLPRRMKRRLRSEGCTTSRATIKLR